MKYQKFYETVLWKQSYELQKQVFSLTETFPKHERYGIGSQLNNSSNSVCANIAEEHGRYHFADKIRVLYIVRGEIEETQSHLIVSVSRKYVPQEVCATLFHQYEQIKMQLNGRIADFSKKKDKE